MTTNCFTHRNPEARKYWSLNEAVCCVVCTWWELGGGRVDTMHRGWEAGSKGAQHIFGGNSLSLVIYFSVFVSVCLCLCVCVSQCVVGQTGCPTVRLSSWSVCCWDLWSEERYLTGTTQTHISRKRPVTLASLTCFYRTVICLLLQVREASGAAGVCVRARSLRPRARRPSSADPLPRCSLPDGHLLLRHQHLLFQSG